MARETFQSTSSFNPSCLDGQTGDPRKQLLRSYLVLPLEASPGGFLLDVTRGSLFRF